MPTLKFNHSVLNADCAAGLYFAV